jgi:hypothetical protein
MFACDIGDVALIKCIFTNTSGAAIDPTTITLYLTQPSGSIGTYTYANGDIAKLSTGTYTYNGTAGLAGYYTGRWVGDGAAVAAERSRYFVRGTVNF